MVCMSFMSSAPDLRRLGQIYLYHKRNMPRELRMKLQQEHLLKRDAFVSPTSGAPPSGNDGNYNRFNHVRKR